jgi:hypothetical protein
MAIRYTFVTSFPDPNGLEKEMGLTDTMVWQLIQLTEFWGSLHGVTKTISVNADQSVRTIIYTVPSVEDELLVDTQALENGVDPILVTNDYITAIKNFGGKVSFRVEEVS